MAPRRDRQVSPGTRPTENGETLWTPQSLAHPTRTLPLRITTTTPLTRTTPASSVPAPAWTAGCSLAALSSPSTTLMARSSSTSACRAAVARISLSPDLGHAPDDYRARATRATFPSDWTIQELQGRKPMAYLVIDGEQVRSLREEKGMSQRHSSRKPRASLRSRLRTSRKGESV